MTREEFTKLPELLSAGQVVECGVPSGALRDLRWDLAANAQAAEMPAGKIGVVQLPGRHCKQKAQAKWKYRKSDVAALIGYK